MTADAQSFHAPALATQALMALFSLVSLAGIVALFLYFVLGFSVMPWRAAAGLCAVALAGLGACWWWVTRPGDPVLVVDATGLDWRLPDGPAARIGWDRVAGYALCSPQDRARIGHQPPPEKRRERCLAIFPRAGGEIRAAYEADVAQGLDEVLAALRRWRPDLEKDA